jgi:hypothetical protein
MWKEGGMSNIFVSDSAKTKIINEKEAYEKLKTQKILPQLTYYTRSYSSINDEQIECGPGFILSFTGNMEDNEGYTLVHVESEFPIFIGPSAIFDLGTHFIDWDDGKFKHNSVRT